MSFDWARELFIDPARGKDDNQIIYTLNHTLKKTFTHPETGLRGSVCVGMRIFKKYYERPCQISKQIIVGVFLCSIKPSFSMDNGIISKLNGFESKPLTVKIDGYWTIQISQLNRLLSAE